MKRRNHTPNWRIYRGSSTIPMKRTWPPRQEQLINRTVVAKRFPPNGKDIEDRFHPVQNTSALWSHSSEWKVKFHGSLSRAFQTGRANASYKSNEIRLGFLWTAPSSRNRPCRFCFLFVASSLRPRLALAYLSARAMRLHRSILWLVGVWLRESRTLSCPHKHTEVLKTRWRSERRLATDWALI